MRIGLNGAGRIGRAFVRALLSCGQDPDLVAINDVMPADALRYLLRFDSVHGAAPAELLADNVLAIGRHTVSYSSVPDAQDIPWDDHGVDLVVEATGRLTRGDQARAHLGRVEHVLISAPAAEADQTVVFGHNDHEIDWAPGRVISAGSCTTNCLTPVASALSAAFGWEAGLVSTVHSYTSDQGLVDSPHTDFRRGRSAATNIVPTTTGAAQAVGLVLPQVRGRFDGRSLRVPIADVSLADLSVVLRRHASAEEVNEVLTQAAASSTVLAVTNEPIVSSDVTGNPASALVDLQLTLTSGALVKVFAWYDNETGYAHRLVDVALTLSRQLEKGPHV